MTFSFLQYWAYCHVNETDVSHICVASHSWSVKRIINTKRTNQHAQTADKVLKKKHVIFPEILASMKT